MLSVAVSHDGRWVVSGSKDRCVQFWDAASATMQCMLQGHKNSGSFFSLRSSLGNWELIWYWIIVISLDLNPAGGMLATGSGDSLARICMSSFSLFSFSSGMLCPGFSIF